MGLGAKTYSGACLCLPFSAITNAIPLTGSPAAGISGAITMLVAPRDPQELQPRIQTPLQALDGAGGGLEGAGVGKPDSRSPTCPKGLSEQWMFLKQPTGCRI